MLPSSPSSFFDELNKIKKNLKTAATVQKQYECLCALSALDLDSSDQIANVMKSKNITTKLILFLRSKERQMQTLAAWILGKLCDTENSDNIRILTKMGIVNPLLLLCHANTDDVDLLRIVTWVLSMLACEESFLHLLNLLWVRDGKVLCKTLWALVAIGLKPQFQKTKLHSSLQVKVVCRLVDLIVDERMDLRAPAMRFLCLLVSSTGKEGKEHVLQLSRENFKKQEEKQQEEAKGQQLTILEVFSWFIEEKTDLHLRTAAFATCWKLLRGVSSQINFFIEASLPTIFFTILEQRLDDQAKLVKELETSAFKHKLVDEAKLVKAIKLPFDPKAKFLQEHIKPGSNQVEFDPELQRLNLKQKLLDDQIQLVEELKKCVLKLELWQLDCLVYYGLLECQLHLLQTSTDLSTISLLFDTIEHICKNACMDRSNKMKQFIQERFRGIQHLLRFRNELQNKKKSDTEKKLLRRIPNIIKQLA